MTKHYKRQRQAGLSLVEMMVGITIGLIVVAAASLMMTQQVTENSRLLLETQLQQDLRAAADLMLRDIRRAGYNSAAASGIWSPTAVGALPVNIYAPTSKPEADADHFYYAYDLGGGGVNVPAGKESFGFARQVADAKTGAHAIYSINGTTFDPTAVPTEFRFAAEVNPAQQPLTDPAVVDITEFKVTLVDQPTAAGAYANPPNETCKIGEAGCPCLVVRLVKITITGQLIRDPLVKRTLQLSSRLRNDQLLPQCTVPT